MIFAKKAKKRPSGASREAKHPTARASLLGGAQTAVSGGTEPLGVPVDRRIANELAIETIQICEHRLHAVIRQTELDEVGTHLVSGPLGQIRQRCQKPSSVLRSLGPDRNLHVWLHPLPPSFRG
jgi:hypothetical protein